MLFQNEDQKMHGTQAFLRTYQIPEFSEFLGKLICFASILRKNFMLTVHNHRVVVHIQELPVVLLGVHHLLFALRNYEHRKVTKKSYR